MYTDFCEREVLCSLCKFPNSFGSTDTIPSCVLAKPLSYEIRKGEKFSRTQINILCKRDRLSSLSASTMPSNVQLPLVLAGSEMLIFHSVISPYLQHAGKRFVRV